MSTKVQKTSTLTDSFLLGYLILARWCLASAAGKKNFSSPWDNLPLLTINLTLGLGVVQGYTSLTTLCGWSSQLRSPRSTYSPNSPQKVRKLYLPASIRPDLWCKRRCPSLWRTCESESDELHRQPLPFKCRIIPRSKESMDLISDAIGDSTWAETAYYLFIHRPCTYYYMQLSSSIEW